MQEIRITSGIADLLKLVESLVHSGYVISIRPVYGEYPRDKTTEYYSVCLIDKGGTE